MTPEPMRQLPDGVVIRAARREEAAEVATVVRRSFVTEAEIYGADVPPLHERTEDVLATFDAGDATVVAEADGGIVGTVRGESLASGALMVRRLCVDAEWRGRGIARALMVALEDAYPAAPVIELFTGSLSAAALALYDSLGYEYTRNESIAPGVDLIYMEKRRGE